MKSGDAADMLTRQMQIVCFTRFHVRGEPLEPMLEARRAWTSDCEACDAFRGGLLVALADGDWLDISIWDPPETEDVERLTDTSLVEFVDRIGGPGAEILGQESGVLALGADAR
jgi:hypothetical protein